MAKTAKAKAKNARNGATKTKVKAAKAPKPTAEQMSDQDRQRLLLAHKRKITPLLEAERLAKAAVNKAFELAKNEGVAKKQLKFAIQLETEEGIEKAKKERHMLAEVARWLGIGKQLDLCGADKGTNSERLYEDGKRAAFESAMRQAPSHVHQTDTKHWYAGYDAGLSHVNAARQGNGGFKKLGDVVDTLVSPPPNGTELQQVAH